MKTDFLCVGYAKCGTTTLDAILRQHSRIALPEIKETGFFLWCDSYTEPAREELKNYYKDLEGKKIGIIEPSFWRKASEVRKHFGEDLKIIFMMRNPVERLYSEFKMRLRHGGSLRLYYKKCKTNDVPTIFHEFVKEEIERKQKENNDMSLHFLSGDYARWVKEYEREFGAENIQLIFMEEFFKDSDAQIQKVLEHIEAPYEKLDTNVKANEGNKVSRGYFTSTINKWLYRRLRTGVLKGRKNAKLKMTLHGFVEALMNFIGIFTLVENKQKMLPETRTLLEDYYRECVKELEAHTGKDLSVLWYK